jgi:hypothetical protein
MECLNRICRNKKFWFLQARPTVKEERAVIDFTNKWSFFIIKSHVHIGLFAKTSGSVMHFKNKICTAWQNDRQIFRKYCMSHSWNPHANKHSFITRKGTAIAREPRFRTRIIQLLRDIGGIIECKNVMGLFRCCLDQTLLIQCSDSHCLLMVLRRTDTHLDYWSPHNLE